MKPYQHPASDLGQNHDFQEVKDTAASSQRLGASSWRILQTRTLPVAPRPTAGICTVISQQPPARWYLAAGPDMFVKWCGSHARSDKLWHLPGATVASRAIGLRFPTFLDEEELEGNPIPSTSACRNPAKYFSNMGGSLDCKCFQEIVDTKYLSRWSHISGHVHPTIAITLRFRILRGAQVATAERLTQPRLCTTPLMASSS